MPSFSVLIVRRRLRHHLQEGKPEAVYRRCLYKILQQEHSIHFFGPLVPPKGLPSVVFLTLTGPQGLGTSLVFTSLVTHSLDLSVGHEICVQTPIWLP